MSTSGCDDDGDFGCESGGGDDGGEGEELWSEYICLLAVGSQ